MAQVTSQSIIIVGGGIVGLCIAVVAQARGHRVTLLDRGDYNASRVAAGMIAPALESINDPDPVESFRRLKAAQQAWLALFDQWPEAVREQLAVAQWAHRHLYLSEDDQTHTLNVGQRLASMEANFQILDSDTRQMIGFDPESQDIIRVVDDWLVSSSTILDALRSHFEMHGGAYHAVEVDAVGGKMAGLADGHRLEADAVVLAAGYGAHRFASTVPSLSALTPIKGQLLEIGGVSDETLNGVVRSRAGYWARHGETAKFGASMQAGRADIDIDPDVEMRQRDTLLAMIGEGGTEITPRAGVRAASPDGWPMIGRDPQSGVLVATAMRRNGYIFAPYAAQVITSLIEGRETPGAEIYRPDRFT